MGVDRGLSVIGHWGRPGATMFDLHSIFASPTFRGEATMVDPYPRTAAHISAGTIMVCTSPQNCDRPSQRGVQWSTPNHRTASPPSKEITVDPHQSITATPPSEWATMVDPAPHNRDLTLPGDDHGRLSTAKPRPPSKGQPSSTSPPNNRYPSLPRGNPWATPSTS